MSSYHFKKNNICPKFFNLGQHSGTVAQPCCLKPRCGFDSQGLLGPFSVDFACCCCVCWVLSFLQLPPTLQNMHMRWIVNSRLTVGVCVSVNGCVSLCVRNKVGTGTYSVIHVTWFCKPQSSQSTAAQWQFLRCNSKMRHLIAPSHSIPQAWQLTGSSTATGSKAQVKSNVTVHLLILEKQLRTKSQFLPQKFF